MGDSVNCRLVAHSNRSSKADFPAPTVDQSALQHLLGYHMAQADIPATAAF